MFTAYLQWWDRYPWIALVIIAVVAVAIWLSLRRRPRVLVEFPAAKLELPPNATSWLYVDRQGRHHFASGPVSHAGWVFLGTARTDARCVVQVDTGVMTTN